MYDSYTLSIGVELRFLYTKRDYHKRLFCTDDRTVNLLNRAASFFFKIRREVMRDALILGVCRLTDPAASKVSGEKSLNLTVEHPVGLIPKAEDSLRQALKPVLGKLKLHRQKFLIDHRDRRIGHLDLQIMEKKADFLLPNITLDGINSALSDLAGVSNNIEKHFEGTWRFYGDGMYRDGTAEDLIELIETKYGRRR